MLAYLIVAYYQPDHLARLIRAVDQENSYFFIHVDKKAAIAPFKTAVPRQANIVFLTDRVPVRWGRLGIVRAVLRLLRAAVASGHAFRYFTLLSGTDYPIKGRQEIYARLRSSDRQFIRIDRKLVGEPRHPQSKFIARLPQGTYSGDLIPYHGSMYWSLTAGCVRFILDFLDENPGFIDRHRHVFSPDEIIFHSLVKASPFAAAIVQDFERGTCAGDVHHANHYIDWPSRDRGREILDERDLEALLASEALFARKLDQERSRQLLDLIDHHVHATGRQPTGQPPRARCRGNEMKITAYPLYATAATLQPSSGRKGWDFLCPCAFEATWQGGPAAEDVEIRLAAGSPGQQDFVQSREGNGLLTFYPGYQCKTEAGHALWVRGPINAPKDSLAPLESVIDTAVLPGTLRIDWKFTRPGQTIRFAAGEPFCTMLPYAKANLNEVAVEVIPLAGTVEEYERALAGMAQSEALGSVFMRLGAGPDPRKREARATVLPAVTCICPAQGRVERLEEATHSFLRQDYPGEKQLIVLNDTEGLSLVYDHPEVQIVNVPRRFHSAAEKSKAAVGLASHDLIFPWPEDDVCLPHRLSFTVAHLAPEAVLFKTDKVWLWNGEELSGPEPEAPHGGSCFRRETFVKVHGYPHTETDYDGGFEALCAGEGPAAVHLQTVEPAEVYSIHRGEALNGHEPPSTEIPQGRIQLHPRWRQDYVALVQERLGTPVSEQPAAPDEIPFPPPFHVIPPPPPVEHPESLFRGDYPLRISVILPATNESVLLQRTVEQFVATLPANSEVIVVDNGSTDGCADFLAEGTWENVRLLRSVEPLGVATARNRGLAAARGEILVFSDAHMDVPERWWELLVRTLNLLHVGVVAPGIGTMGRPAGRLLSNGSQNHNTDEPMVTRGWTFFESTPPGTPAAIDFTTIKQDRNSACGQRIADANLRLEWLPVKAAEPYPVPTLGGGFMAMRHDTLKLAGAFDEGMPQWGSEDLELCVRYWLLGYEV